MGWHHKMNPRMVHTPYRFIAADEAERLAILTNQDGSPITDEDGLYCTCLQEDTGAVYCIVNTDPLEWVQTGGGGSSSQKKNIHFSVHAPAEYTDFPLGWPFKNIFMNRLAPNIGSGGSFDLFGYCIWDVIETSNAGTVNQWKGLDFANYTELESFCNSNLTGSGGSLENGLSIIGYTIQKNDVDPFRKIYGLNTFFSVLRGRDAYKSSGYSDKTMRGDLEWDNVSDFISRIYQDFLGVSAPPLANAARTVWFPQSHKRVYDHHRQPIEFPSGNSSQRRYYSTTNNTTYAIPSGSRYHYERHFYYVMDSSGYFWGDEDRYRDEMSMGTLSGIRVSLYQADDASSHYAFFVKPVGMDQFHLGFHPCMHGKIFTIFAEYDTPDRFMRLYEIKTVTPNDNPRNYGMNTSVTVFKRDFLHKIIMPAMRNHVRSDSIIGRVRFVAIDEDGNCFPPSRWLTIYRNQAVTQAYVLLK